MNEWISVKERLPNNGDLPFVRSILIDEPEQATPEEARAFAKRYAGQLQEEKKQLNIRMDFLEQRMLDMLRRMDSL